MGSDQKIEETSTATNKMHPENQQKLKSNDRKRKQLTNTSSRPTRSHKVRAILNNEEEEEEVNGMNIDDGSSLSTIQQLPIILLTQIVSNLNIREQKNFAETCKAARLAVKLYWNTRTDLHIGTLMRQTFSFINERNRYSLHAIRKEVGLTLRLIPNLTLRKISFQPICLLHVQHLKDVENRSKKSAKEIYGAVKHLDLRGCLVEYNELQYFSNACTRLASIAVTYAAVFLPNEIFINDDYMKQNKMLKCPFGTVRDFLRVSLPKFAEMEKNRQLPAEHIELLAKLLMLFPYLETFHIE